MKDEELIWEEISTEHIVQDEWIDFRRSAYRFPDGKIWQPYYSFTRRNYAVVVASDEEGRFICVRQFRQGIKQVTTEFPAGAIEQKDGEDPQTAALRGAQRELREETGYVSDTWRPLLTIPSNATISDNYAYLFAAENCRKVTGQELDMGKELFALMQEPSIFKFFDIKWKDVFPVKDFILCIEYNRFPFILKAKKCSEDVFEVTCYRQDL